MAGHVGVQHSVEAVFAVLFVAALRRGEAELRELVFGAGLRGSGGVLRTSSSALALVSTAFVAAMDASPAFQASNSAVFNWISAVASSRAVLLAAAVRSLQVDRRRVHLALRIELCLERRLLGSRVGAHTLDRRLERRELLRVGLERSQEALMRHCRRLWLCVRRLHGVVAQRPPWCVGQQSEGAAGLRTYV